MTISTQRLRFLRGNSTAVAAFTGLQGELVFNTDTYTLHLQDGSTAGGYSLATSAQLANVSANANYGNSNVASYLASNSNIVITTTGNVTTNNSVLANNFIAANSIAIGGANSSQQHSLLISNVGTAVKFLTGNRANGNTSIQLQANNTLSGIYLRNDNGSMGFNTIPTGPNIGYTFTFNGSLYASEFYTDANMPTGYQFTTTGDTGISHIDYGAVSAIRIRHEGVETVAFYDNNTTEMRGNIVVSDGTSYGTFPNAYMQIYGNVNSYQQVVNQNLNNGPLASSDFVATAGNGNDSTYFVDLGIASNTYSYPGYGIIKPNDAYLLAVGQNITGPGSVDSGNLILGSTTGNIKMFIGAPEDANLVATLTETGLMPGANTTYDLGSTVNYWRDIYAVSVTGDYGLSLKGPVYDVEITANSAGANKTWGFYTDGRLNLPGDLQFNNGHRITQESNYDFDITVTNANVNIGSGASSWIFDNNGDLTVPNYIKFHGNTFIGDEPGSGTPEFRITAPLGYQAIIQTDSDISGNNWQWTFGNDGNLTLPGSISVPGQIVVTGGIEASLATSPAPYISGFSSISTVSNTGTSGNITASGNLNADLNARITGNLTAGNITSGNLTVSGNINGNTSGFAIGYKDIPQVTFTSNATLALTDAGKHYYSANSANIITVPNNATVSFNIGTAISIVQQGTANLTVSPGSGVTMYLAGNSTSAARTLGNYGMATLMKVATDTWFINGTGLT